ncbi:RNA polymerase sigma factor, RpoD/SigA family [Nostoc sp. FACHB-145]|uniref:RNA polymerase sigma factor, RpoD/SigA family n=1 Tax=Nostoc sp. FACHB-145 TaxID=2692836 RepID=UPI001689AB8E|nr:RNA polymerase sigma factor, RpoD/SigA family [Nostoc sp. FACHB-145]MBD2472291.1 RNA polymerase sigma factor, RpoD/SigA family [Nostoc sp. FACHB-145]
MSRLDSDTVGIYLKEISRFPLLRPEQEILYARQIQELIAVQQKKSNLQQQLHREITNAELAAKLKITEAQLNFILEQGQRAKQKMINANLRLVVAIAKKHQWSNLDLLDLVQEGAIGLQQAVEKFDPSRGYKFSTYAYWWIRQAIMRAIAEKSRTVRLPCHLSEKFMRIRKVQQELSQKFGRPATITEIAKVINVQPTQVREYLAAFRQPVSLDLQVGEERDTQLQELLPDDSISPFECVAQELFSQDMNNWLSLLTPIQRQVILLRFGFSNEGKLTAKQIAQKLQISPASVNHLQQQAIKVLRREPKQIQEYLAG